MKNQFLTKYAINYIIGVTVFALFLGSCKKEADKDEEGNPDIYMISFKANGVLQKFTSEHFPLGSIYDNGTQYTCLITGTRSASKIGIEAYDNKPIAEKMPYTGYIATQATQTPGYVIGAAISYLDGQAIYITPFDNPSVRVEITKITDKTVQGKFSGTLKSNGKPDLIITEGEFFVPLGVPNN